MACRYTYQGKTYEAHEFDDVLRAMAPEIAAKYMSGVASVPSAPFVTDTKAWVALAVKRMIAHAAQNGYDKVAFVTGEQSAERYDLSKQISRVEYMPEKQELTAYGTDGSAILEKTVAPENIEDYVGKEVAKNLLESEPILTGSGKKKHSITGDGLKVGGEGMKTFYDKIVPQVVNDVLKKVGGGKVESIRFNDFESKNGASDDKLLSDLGVEVSGTRPAGQSGFTITPAIREKVAGGQALFSNPRFASSVQPIWNTTEPSRFENFRRKYQDRFIDAKKILADIRAQVGEFADKWDGYLQEQIYHSRVSGQVKDFIDLHMRPLIDGLTAAGADVKNFETYLWARHAEERNAQVAKVNPTMPDGGSGLTNQQALDVMNGKDVTLADGTVVNGVDQAMLEVYGQFANRIDLITKDTRNILVAGGIEKASTVAAWENVYQHYVPLMRDDESGGMEGSGRGYSAGGNAKRAFGSGRGVEEIIGNIAAARERAIKRVEKTRVAMSFFGLAIQAPNPNFWAPIKPGIDSDKLQQELLAMGIDPASAVQMAEKPKVRYADPNTGLMVERPNPLFAQQPNVISIRINGEDRHLVFNADNKRAMELAGALSNMTTDQVEGFAKMVAPATRWMASVSTQYNPLFGIVNIVRDTQGMVLNLSTTQLADQKWAILKEIPKMLAGIYTDQRSRRAGNGPTDSEAAKLYDEFVNEGGATGYMDLFSDAGSRTRSLLRMAGVVKHENKILQAVDGAWVKFGGKRVVEDVVGGWLSDYNQTLENATRLSAYKVALDNGMSKARAAELAKNITVNFNRKGTAGANMGSLYAFFNASAQGTQRLAETLAGPKGKQIIAGGIMLGALQALALVAAGFGPDEPPDFVRERNLIIPIGDKKYLTIPMPLGFHILPNIGRAVVEAAMYPKRAGEKLTGLMVEMINSFNPVGSGTLLQTLSPTVVDPIAALAENKDWRGQPIARTGFDKTKPGHLLAKDTATTISKEISYWINAMTGGTDYQRGKFSPTPDQIDYIGAQIGGGVYREFLKGEQSVSGFASGEEVPPHKIPLVGRFYGNSEGQASVANQYYRTLEEMKRHAAEIDGRRKDRLPIDSYLRENPEARLANAAEKSEKRLQFLKRNKRKAVEAGDKERVKNLETQITEEMSRFNERATGLASQ